MDIGVSMPSVGLLSFLSKYLQNPSRPTSKCVNALSRASLISTREEDGDELFLSCVSMPLVGLLSFLQESIKDTDVVGGCQCP